VRSATVIIESRWGALGALALLQAYGLMLAYYFADAIRHLGSTSSIYELPGHAFEVGVGLVFLAVFIFSQGYLLDEVSTFLKNAKTPGEWIREAVRWRGIWRLPIAIAAILLYVALLLGIVTFDHPPLHVSILLGYQVFSLFASRWLAKRFWENRPAHAQYVSVACQLMRISICFAAAFLFYGLGIWMKEEQEPAGWMFQMMGAFVGMSILVELLLEGIQGRTREIIGEAD